MTDIVISEFMDEHVVRSAFRGRDVLYDPKLVDDSAALHAALADARAIVVRNRTQVRAGLLAAAPKLTVVGRLGVGLDNIDMDACRARGVRVFPASGANDLAVAEYVITAIMLLLRRSWFATAQVAAGTWPRTTLMGRETLGKHLGLLGYGAIARATAQRARALGMRISAYDPYLASDHEAWNDTGRLDLDALFAECDVVSCHVPLTAETHHIANVARIARMRDGAILINAARGGIVDENALVAALRAGRLGGAALDVFETEPVTAATGARFAGIPNLILTPHIAGVTEESNRRVSEVTAAAVLGALDA